MTREDLIETAKAELYEALEALEDGKPRLVTARQCAARAASYVCEAWKEFPKERIE